MPFNLTWGQTNPLGEMFRSLLDKSKNGILLVSKVGQVVYANETMRKFGMSPKKLLQLDISDVALYRVDDPDAETGVMEMVDSVLEDGKKKTRNGVVLADEKGRDFFLNVDFTPVQDPESDEITAVMIEIEDETIKRSMADFNRNFLRDLLKGGKVEDIWENILASAIEETNSDKGTIRLVDDDTGDVLYHYAIGLDAPEQQAILQERMEEDTAISQKLRRKVEEGMGNAVMYNDPRDIIERGGMKKERVEALGIDCLLGARFNVQNLSNHGNTANNHNGRSRHIELRLYRGQGEELFPYKGEDAQNMTALGSEAAVAFAFSELLDSKEKAHKGTIRALAQAVEEKDPYTRGHSERVKLFAVAMAERMGLADDQIETIETVGVLHDIGKIGVPLEILHKDGKLTDEEYEVIQTHAEIGQRIVAQVEEYSQVAEHIRRHHEMVSGKGYPDGLTAKELTDIDKIMAVADAFDAMTSDRPYRRALPLDEARTRIDKDIGTQFDAKVVEAFKGFLDDTLTEYKRPENAESEEEPFKRMIVFNEGTDEQMQVDFR